MNNKYFLSIAFACMLWLTPSILLAATTETQSPDLGASLPKISNPIANPNLSVSIPGFSGFRNAECNGEECIVPWIADYINALYTYGLSIIGILAVIVLMIGGIMWIGAGGKEERIKEAKNMIAGSLFGVIIAASSYMILYIINPALTQLSPIKVSYIGKEDLGAVEYDELTPPNTRDTTDCPSGNTSISSLATYFTKTATLKYSQPQRGTCDGGTCYCDCSWFSMHLGKCANLKEANGEGTSASLIGNSSKIKITSADCDNPPLKAGDIIVWRKPSQGHVMTYIGNNQMIECGGGSGGTVIEKQGAVKISDWKSRCHDYLLKRNAYYIKR